jgi:hypothetical protein
MQTFKKAAALLKTNDTPPLSLTQPDVTSGSQALALGERLRLSAPSEPSVFLVNEFSTGSQVQTSEQMLEESCPRALTSAVDLNPWPFFWVVVGAWLWYGALHLAHLI